ncbi:nuclease-related domain-containing protein [Spirillospora sp. CA-128828]|uniref:nuclease-related domain-containing protein n=1 Tax=Spirillospora sp. CA-128828 TaxID=3240033 RepID=UPI003D8E7A76
MYEVGRAGAFVSRQMWRHRTVGSLYAAAAVALAVAAAGCFLGLLVFDASVPRVLAAIAGVAALVGCGYAWIRATRVLRQARRSAIGARSEREVRAAVRHTGSIAAAYGLVLGNRGGDCDTVVFTRGGGAAAIEVKTGHGQVSADNGTMRVGARVLHGDPVRQAANQARRLSRKMGGRTVLAVVCVPGMRNRPFTAANGVWVCSAKDLKGVLDRAPRVFRAAEEAQETMRNLWEATPA